MHGRRNYALFFMDTVLFTNAMTFLAVSTVIAYFLDTLGATAYEVGLVNALVGIGSMATQPLFAGWAMRARDKRRTFSFILLTQRAWIAVCILSLPWLVGAGHAVAIWAFVVMWGVFNLFTGSYSPFYMLLFAKMVGARHRGRLRGFSGAIANGLALLSTVAIGFILRYVSFPENYTIVFSCGSFLLLLDALNFLFMKEPPDTAPAPVVNPWQYLRQIPVVLRENRIFARMVLSFTLLVGAQSSIVYITLDALHAYPSSAGDVAIFTGLTAAVNIAANLILGVAADRHGHRLILQIASLGTAAAGLLAVAIHSLTALFAAFALLTLGASAYNLSGTMLIIERSQRDTIAIWVSVNVMITLAVSSFFLVLAGYLAHWFGYAPIFVIIFVAGVLAFVSLSSVPRIRPQE